MPANILVFGTGSVGSIYAALLLRAGASVTTVCRSNLAAVRACGISITSKKWGDFTQHPTSIVRSVSEAAEAAAAAGHAPFTHVLVTTKSFPGQAELIRPAVGADTAIVLAQNGIAIEDEYAAAYPGNVLISGVVWLPATTLAPGKVMHTATANRLELGIFSAGAAAEAGDQGARAKLQVLVDLFAAAEATAVFCEDVQRERWIKLAVNASMNPVCALTMCDDSNLFRSSERALKLVRDVQLEVGAVADAAGYKGAITLDGVEKQIETYGESVKAVGAAPSMLADVSERRPMEVEAILGNLVRLAEKYKVEVKLLNMLYVLALARDSEIVRDERWWNVDNGA